MHLTYLAPAGLKIPLTKAMDLSLHQLPEEAMHHQREFGSSSAASGDADVQPLPTGLPDRAKGQAAATSPLSSVLKVMTIR